MAIPFLNNINLDDNQLQNAKLHVTSSSPTAAAAQIYFDSTTGVEAAKYYSNATDQWVTLSEYSFTGDTFITVTKADTNSTDAKQTVTIELSATDGTAAAGERYLTKNNTWAEVAAIPGTYTFNVTADGGTPQTIDSGDTLDIAGGTYITTSVGATDTVTITHDSTSRSDTTSTPAQLAFGDTFDAVTSVTTNATGHVTAINVATYELPDQPQTTITLTGEVTGSGTTNISTTVADGVLDVANFNAAAIVTEAEGIENNDNDTTLPTSAAVKAYADSLVVGGLIYQGGYNASTNTPDLTTSPNSILKGWTYTVTADGTFFGEQLRVGDVLIAEVDGPSSLADWTTVQNNIDLASLTQVGIGNVNASAAFALDGLSVTYSSGTATVGLDIDSLPQSLPSSGNSDAYLAYYDNGISANKKIDFDQLASEINSTSSYAATISDTATITHSLATRDVIIQLYDTVTYETVYADVDRISTTQATITFATTNI